MLAQLESKILDLQAQITDYQTNPVYKTTELHYDLRGFPYDITESTKAAKLTQIQAT